MKVLLITSFSYDQISTATRLRNIENIVQAKHDLPSEHNLFSNSVEDIIEAIWNFMAMESTWTVCGLFN